MSIDDRLTRLESQLKKSYRNNRILISVLVGVLCIVILSAQNPNGGLVQRIAALEEKAKFINLSKDKQGRVLNLTITKELRIVDNMNGREIRLANGAVSIWCPVPIHDNQLRERVRLFAGQSNPNDPANRDRYSGLAMFDRNTNRVQQMAGRDDGVAEFRTPSLESNEGKISKLSATSVEADVARIPQFRGHFEVSTDSGALDVGGTVNGRPGITTYKNGVKDGEIFPP